MDSARKTACPENEDVAAYLMNKRHELAQSSKGISDNMDMTLSKAHSNICNHQNPIRNLKDLAQIKGVGKWILKQMQGFFQADGGPSEIEDLTKKGNKNKGPKRYVPQKNSVAYALLISLFRGTENGNEFMHKKELIDAAETSGLSRVPIAPEKAKGKAGHFGSSPRDWYTGWNCMKTLISRGLVVKSSCPAKYMLTEEGKEVARECLLRSGMVGPNKKFDGLERCPDLVQRDKVSVVDLHEDLPDVECVKKKAKISVDIPPDYLEKGTDISSLDCLQEDDIDSISFISKSRTDGHYASSSLFQLRDGRVGTNSGDMQRNANDAPSNKSSLLHTFGRSSCTLKPCSSNSVQENVTSQPGFQGSEANPIALATPPLAFGEKFGDVYEVVLILDNREQFAMQGSRSRKIIENICSLFQMQIEVRRLPVGDGIWIARHKYIGSEFVLDFIVERKKVDDLRQSIRDNRYRDQKMRLVRCGLKKMIYLVEGDPNSSEAAESIKTACFTTEILEGFDVQRTNGLADTLKKYGNLTQSINQYYRSLDTMQQCIGGCPPFDEFIKRCEDLDKMTVSDVFGIQLMQVSQVTEEIALAVLDMYPTLLSLASAYSLLVMYITDAVVKLCFGCQQKSFDILKFKCLKEGDAIAQEEMLKRQSNNLISGPASKNIFQLIWGG